MSKLYSKNYFRALFADNYNNHKSSLSMKTFLSLFLILAGINTFGNGFKQEIWIYMVKGGALYFDTAIPDLSLFRHLLETNKGFHDYCVRGLWFGYLGTNYGRYGRVFPNYNGTGEDLVCGSDYFETLYSLRHVAANDTSIDSISLYSRGNYSGAEILVVDRALTGITTHTKSIISTGNSGWILFEGSDLDGKSVCFEAPGDSGSFHSAESYGLIKTIGSVFKGCGLKELELYKAQHNNLSK